LQIKKQGRLARGVKDKTHKKGIKRGSGVYKMKNCPLSINLFLQTILSSVDYTLKRLAH
jgi:hypothetical protein